MQVYCRHFIRVLVLYLYHFTEATVARAFVLVAVRQQQQKQHRNANNAIGTLLTSRIWSRMGIPLRNKKACHPWIGDEMRQDTLLVSVGKQETRVSFFFGEKVKLKNKDLLAIFHCCIYNVICRMTEGYSLSVQGYQHDYRLY
jgi:hypothetical protein